MVVVEGVLQAGFAADLVGRAGACQTKARGAEIGLNVSFLFCGPDLDDVTLD